MFQGPSALSLDAKGRMSVPARYRDALVGEFEGKITITRHPDGCLLLFPRPVWEAHREQISAWPIQARDWKRIFLGNAFDVELDGNGRVLIAPELRNAVGIQRDIMMLGMGSHFEIWDTGRLAENEANAKAAGAPEVLNNFSF